MVMDAAKDATARAACQWGRFSLVIGAIVSHVRNLAFTLIGEDRALVPGCVHLDAYWSDNADGSTITASAPTTTVIGTNGLSIPVVTGKMFKIVTKSDGTFDLNVTYNGTATWYLCLCKPDGGLLVSSAISFV